MKQLSGLDASWLYTETPGVFGHVCGVSIYERPSRSFRPYDTVRTRLASLLGELEPLRRRLVEVPLHLDHPYWIVDPDFDLDRHVHRVELPAPRGTSDLAELVADLAGQPMDRSKPLWDAHVVDSLDDGTWAVVMRFHHAAIDGASATRVQMTIHTTASDSAIPHEQADWDTEAVPKDARLLAMSLQNLAHHPARALRIQAQLARPLTRAAGRTITAARDRLIGDTTAAEPDAAVERPASRRPAPATPWNKSVSAGRRFVMHATSLDSLKRIKTAAGVSLNDVVLAVCAGALREYLNRHDALPDRPLTVLVPVSVRTGDEPDPWTNRVSAIFAELPTDEPDPLQRLARCNATMAAAKRQLDLVPADTMIEASQLMSPALAVAASRLAAEMKLADRVDSPINLVISNVPGPRQPMYLGKAKLLHQYPASLLLEGQGLNITVQSYVDQLDFGLMADRALVPDLDVLADLIDDEITHLEAATGTA